MASSEIVETTEEIEQRSARRRDLEQELKDATGRLRTRESQFRLVTVTVISVIGVATALFLFIAWRGYARLANVTEDNVTISKQVAAGQACLRKVLFIPPEKRAALTEAALRELCPDVKTLGDLPSIDDETTTTVTATTVPRATATSVRRTTSTTGRSSPSTTTPTTAGPPPTTTTTQPHFACTTIPVVDCQL